MSPIVGIPPRAWTLSRISIANCTSFSWDQSSGTRSRISCSQVQPQTSAMVYSSDASIPLSFNIVIFSPRLKPSHSPTSLSSSFKI
ncbi:hypothetical protein KC19_VG109200 [Ceratodon purpureus]|uniref:Uncharacterized protein n=1 Tax=Ceratodon purpureus TaxID=3225 RepID=A0A8T0HNU8_CERPU|nr:hypothetical protein KC19_VG109200 [Ceratodon purpureus]